MGTSEWVELVDKESTKVYYLNIDSCAITWTKPMEYEKWLELETKKYLKSSGSNWRIYFDEKKGKTYYANKATHATVWSIPDEVSEQYDRLININYQRYKSSKGNDDVGAVVGTSDMVSGIGKRKLETVEMKSCLKSAKVESGDGYDNLPSVCSKYVQKDVENGSIVVNDNDLVGDCYDMNDDVSLGTSFPSNITDYLKNTPDTLLESNIVDVLQHHLESKGESLSSNNAAIRTDVVETLTQSYIGMPSLCGVLGRWIERLQSHVATPTSNSNTDSVDGVLFECLVGNIRDKLDLKLLDRAVFNIGGSGEKVDPDYLPLWLTTMVDRKQYRLLLLGMYELCSNSELLESKRLSQSLLLEKGVYLMVSSGHAR